MAKILVIDERERERKRLCEILAGQSYALYEAADSRQALDIAAAQRPDLIIADSELPPDDYFQLCTHLTKDPLAGHIPVILLSGWTIAVGGRRGPDVGAADFITKPLNENEVLARVRSQLKLQELAKALATINEELRKNQCSIEESLKSAALIQRSLLPASPPAVDSLAFAWRFMPSEGIGGDLFNVFRLDESHLAIYILDVSGRGVPAAMVTASVAQTLSPYLGHFLKRTTNVPPYYELVPPATVLDKLNSEYPIERFDKFFTLCYLLINTKTGHVRYSNAAHPRPLHVRPGGTVEQLPGGGPIIGLGEGACYEEGDFTMEPGDRLFLFTDGIIEHANGSGELYGDARLAGELLVSRRAPLQAACDHVISSLLGFGEARKPEDDVTILGMEYLPPR